MKAVVATIAFFLHVSLIVASPAFPGNNNPQSSVNTAPGWKAMHTTSGLAVTSLSMPVLLPLELQIGQYLIQKETGNLPLPGQTLFQGSNPVFQRASTTVGLSQNPNLKINVREGAYRPVHAANTRNFHPHEIWLGAQPYQYQQAMTLAYRFDHTNLLFDVGRSRSLTSIDRQEENPEKINAGFALGWELSGLQHSVPVQLLFGVGSRHSVVDPFREQQRVGAEYGAVYFTPGFQIEARSVVIETVFEVPFHSYDLRNESGSADEKGYSDIQDVRARFGMKYYLD